jgi:apolipoprotein N-acyltransferase
MTTACHGQTIPIRGEPSAQPEHPRVRTGWPVALIPALATAALLWLSYFPADYGWLAWIALVPWLCLVRSSAPARRIYLAAWIGGLVFFAAALQWVRVADYRMYASWIGLAIYCSFFVPPGLYLVRQLDRRTRLPLIVTVPLVWSALEFLRAHALGGFAWYFLGHTQHAFLPIIQVADLAGGYAVTFLLATVNALVFEVLYSRHWFRALFSLPVDAPAISSSGLRIQMGAVMLLVSAAFTYGFWRLSQNDFEEGPRVALLQGNLDQRLRNEASSPEVLDERLDEIRRYYDKLCDDALPRRPGLIVWPETSFIYDWAEVSPTLSDDQIPPEWKEAKAYHQKLVRLVVNRWPANMLVGVNAVVLGPDARPRRYNSAVLFQKDGQVGGRYDKIHCVPFGEYVPFRDTLPWLNTFAPYDFDYSVTPGECLTHFSLGKYRFGVVICYEDTDPCLARQYVRPSAGEPPVDFLLNISNDGWFDGTSEHEEHLAICRFRAIECRRAVARAVNMGISAVIDGSGRVVALPGPDWARSKKMEAVLTANIPIDRRASVYASWGDWLPWTCWLMLSAGLIAGRVRPARSRSAKLA